ncbi:MAG: DUF4931 domain-containing protein, partial [Nitrospinaceae bacterium]|nr:DUF4931 domain-containing protein [Nitrospinaceae bacterium]NIR54973.1 DUF4931 domain-containing protein [Nitrospinaceae bacterium]NIS85386.1 DUF4931 domain-containing protein [Nitrospinaceae bacterium]NIT82213.1 DUF4931 domain-containing protein [Nitrospinaceae bacterium]NIU44457.1 DUF4931 domain-containing protein [Nitrospinaceae bacterium]
EVIIETPEHPMDLPGLPVARMEDFFRSWKERIGALGREAGFRYILIFKNYGEPSGASLEHAHSQLIALPIIPELVSEEIAGARLHHQKTRRCIY